jgi:hemolysin activation/secretion protein
LSSCVTDNYVPLSVSYSVTRAAPDSSVDATLSATFGARGIGSTPREFINTRSFATGNFVHVNLDFTVMQAFWDDIQAVMHFSGQIADQPLVPTEQFAAGGLSSVRGYLQSEAIGDNGLVDSFELRSPSVAPYVGSFVDDWRLFIFAELADVGVLDALPSQKSNYQLASTGIGSRLATLGHFSGSVDVAWPLLSGQYTKAYDPVTSFTFKAEF